MKKGDATKELIVERSAELFNTVGYEGTSLLHIMKATGLQKGGIYNHFKNKDEIALSAFDHSFHLVLRRFKEALANCSTSLEKINAIIDVFQSFAKNPVMPGGCPIFNTAMDATDLHPELRKKAQEGINTLIKYVEIKVEEGIIEEEFKHGVNASDFALFLVSTLEGALMVSRVNDDPKHADSTAAMMRTYIQKELIS